MKRKQQKSIFNKTIKCFRNYNYNFYFFGVREGRDHVGWFGACLYHGVVSRVGLGGGVVGILVGGGGVRLLKWWKISLVLIRGGTYEKKFPQNNFSN